MNFQFTQAHINRLAAAGVEWAPSVKREGFGLYVKGLTFRGLLVGTATDFLGKVYGQEYNVQLLDANGAVVYSKYGIIYSAHPTQEENLIEMICDLSARLKAKDMPDVEKMTVEELAREISGNDKQDWFKMAEAFLRETVRRQRIEKKVGI